MYSFDFGSPLDYPGSSVSLSVRGLRSGVSRGETYDIENDGSWVYNLLRVPISLLDQFLDL